MGEEVRGRERGDGSPSSRDSSWVASPVMVVSTPFAVPVRAPALGTRSMGAWVRFWCPDLTRLFETVSLKEYNGYFEHVWHCVGDEPDFSSKVVNGVPS